MNRRGWPAPVLLVEDNPGDVALAGHALAQSGLNNPLEVARSVEEANQRIDRWMTGEPTPQVILLDLGLPDGNGLELLSRIKRHSLGQTIPVVVFSGSSSERDVRTAYDIGACSYVTKPHRFDEYVRYLGEVTAYWCQLNQTYAADAR